MALPRAQIEKSLNEGIPLDLNIYNNQRQQHQDGYSKSINIFAHKNGHNFDNNMPIVPSTYNASSIDAIMQDFANNGCVSDDIRFQAATNNNNMSFNVMTDFAFNNTNEVAFFHTSTQTDVSNKILLQKAPLSSNLTCDQNNYQQQEQNEQQQQYLQQHAFANWNNNILIQKASSYCVQQQQQQYLNSYVARSTVTALSPLHNVIDINMTNTNKYAKRSGSTNGNKYVGVRRCVFCENNNEPEAVVKSHSVRDSYGNVLCPKLRIYVCPICKASGDHAHTIKYCPKKRIITMEDALKSKNELYVTKSQFPNQK